MSKPSFFDGIPFREELSENEQATVEEPFMFAEVLSDPYLVFMKEIVETHREMRKAYLKQLISISENHNLLMQDSIRMHQKSWFK